MHNVDALMQFHWGGINKSRLRKEAGIGQGTYDRIADGTSIGLEVLEKIAALFKLEPWQLIATQIDPLSPPKIMSHWPFDLFGPDDYEMIPVDYRKRIENELAGEILRARKKPNGTSG